MSQQPDYDPLYPTLGSNAVICPQLHTNLAAAFGGGVIIANQGIPMVCHSVRMYNGSHETVIVESGEYYRVNCPFCRDTRHRLWVNHRYGQPGLNGRPMKFLAKCYNEDCLSDRDNWQQFDNAAYGFVNANIRHRMQFALNNPTVDWEEGNNLRVVEPPGQLIPMSDLMRSMPNHPAVQYLCGDRRYTDWMFDHYEISYCISVSKSRYATALNRIIFPIKRDGNLVGWQAREVPAKYGQPFSARGPKYWGMPGMRKRFMLYNYDNAINKDYLVITEGPTDVHSVGDNAVAILGKSMAYQQYQLVLNHWQGKPVIMILDPDAYDESRGVVQNMLSNNVVVVEIRLPDGYDCGDYDRSTLRNIIHSSARDRGVILSR